MRISDWSSDVCSSDLDLGLALDGEDKHSAIAMAVAIVAEMGNAATRKGVSTSEWNLIKSAVQWTIDGGYADEGIDSVRAWLGAYPQFRSEEHTSELKSLMRISYAVFCLKKKTEIN